MNPEIRENQKRLRLLSSCISACRLHCFVEGQNGYPF